VKLGIIVNTDRHSGDVIGITRAAVSRGHEVSIFVMDEGTKLLPDPEFSSLCRIAGVAMNFCAFNAKQLEIKTEELAPEVISGSQYDNAVMNHTADRVIVL
jgi:predicted peroxiredoxin